MKTENESTVCLGTVLSSVKIKFTISDTLAKQKNLLGNSDIKKKANFSIGWPIGQPSIII